MEHIHLVSFLLLFALIIAAAKAAGLVSRYLGQPAVLGEILAGVLLGPSVLDILRWPAFHQGALEIVVAHLANLGVIFLMFIAGVETNVEQMRKVGKVASLSGVLGVFAPLGLGLSAALLFGYALHPAIYIGIVLTATSVGVTVQTLNELDKLNTREGTALLAAAIIDDVLAVIILSLFVALTVHAGGAGSIGLTLIRTIGFFVLAFSVGRGLSRRMLTQSERWPVSEGLLASVAVILFALAWGAEALGRVAPITGAYIAGLFVAGAGYRSYVEKRLNGFVFAILVPVFFVNIGLQTNAQLLTRGDLPFTGVIVLVAIVGKVLGSGGGALAGGFAPAEALRVGVGMVSRGEVGLVIAAIGIQNELLSQQAFAVMVITILATTAATPILLRMTFSGRTLGPF